MRLLGKSRKYTNGQAARDVHRQRCKRESGRARRVHDEPTKQVTGDRTKKTATADQQKVSQGCLSIGSWDVWKP